MKTQELETPWALDEAASQDKVCGQEAGHQESMRLCEMLLNGAKEALSLMVRKALPDPVIWLSAFCFLLSAFCFQLCSRRIPQPQPRPSAKHQQFLTDSGQVMLEASTEVYVHKIWIRGRAQEAP